MSKNWKMLLAIICVVAVAAIVIILIALNGNKYEFDINTDNSFIKESNYMEIYNSNSVKKTKTVTQTVEVNWSNSNGSSVKNIKKVKVVAYVKAEGREYYLTEKGLVYTKNKKGKITLLKSKATKIGTYDDKPVVETGNKVYYIEVKNGKYVIDKTLKMEETKTVTEEQASVLPVEDKLNKNIKKKLAFNGKDVQFEDGDYLKDKESGENIKVLYAIYIANDKESRYYIVSDNMKLYVLTDNSTELEQSDTVKSVLVNSKGVEIDLTDDKLVFEKK